MHDGAPARMLLAARNPLLSRSIVVGSHAGLGWVLNFTEQKLDQFVLDCQHFFIISVVLL